MTNVVYLWAIIAIVPIFIGYLFATAVKHKLSHIFSFAVPLGVLVLYLALELFLGQYDPLWPVFLLLGGAIVSGSGYAGFAIGKWIFKDNPS